jgi:hypothetical protein
MHFAVSHDAVATGHPAEMHESSAAKQRRVATTATLLAVALCAVMAKGHLLAAQTPSRVAAAAQNSGTAPVTIVAPEFCKDQTWPYIDSRCLRRVAPDTPQATVPPATTTAAAPAPSGGSAKTVAATPPTAETSVAQTTVATNATPAAAEPNPTDTQDQGTQSQVMQSVFPAAAAPDTSTYPATNAYTRASNAPQRRRSEHWNSHSGFFGFRF